ncbi:39S ribosomal mitochondrial [Brachionus plicatilis]|uniref:Large ribosomal subunit protein uL29m n=1 Tax=Brachionus plicatilis TaxID=10195 RepID=A0A3M7PHN4_BRAPC|nr:39S ribosomal mitochondrial [Brachionus plicatilis]
MLKIISRFNKALSLGNDLSKLIPKTTPAVLPLHQLTKKFNSTSVTGNKLMEFFDDKKNWTEEKVKHGRPWTLDELRLKSNVDLHKLWYILHKERNMLLTMEEIYKQKDLPMPSHERIAKVDETMENVLGVVEERNIAFNLLETGETKKLIPYRRYNSFGHIQYYKPREYLVPWYLNRMWKLKYHYKKIPYWSKFYSSLNRVRLRKERRKLVKKVDYSIHKVTEKHPEYAENKEYLREYFEKKYGYKPPRPYHELVRKPAPNELPKNIQERLHPKKQFYDDEF